MRREETRITIALSLSLSLSLPLSLTHLWRLVVSCRLVLFAFFFRFAFLLFGRCFCPPCGALNEVFLHGGVFFLFLFFCAYTRVCLYCRNLVSFYLSYYHIEKRFFIIFSVPSSLWREHTDDDDDDGVGAPVFRAFASFFVFFLAKNKVSKRGAMDRWSDRWSAARTR